MQIIRLPSLPGAPALPPLLRPDLNSDRHPSWRNSSWWPVSWISLFFFFFFLIQFLSVLRLHTWYFFSWMLLKCEESYFEYEYRKMDWIRRSTKIKNWGKLFLDANFFILNFPLQESVFIKFFNTFRTKSIKTRNFLKKMI